LITGSTVSCRIARVYRQHTRCMGVSNCGNTYPGKSFTSFVKQGSVRPTVPPCQHPVIINTVHNSRVSGDITCVENTSSHHHLPYPGSEHEDKCLGIPGPATSVQSDTTDTASKGLGPRSLKSSIIHRTVKWNAGNKCIAMSNMGCQAVAS